METLEFLNRAFRNIDLPPLSDDDMRDIGDALRPTRPTPDGEIGELVAYLHDEARSYAAKLTPMTVCAARDDGYRPPLPEETTFWKAATALETQAADIARLREALADAVVLLLTLGAETGPGTVVDEANAILRKLDDDAALATRTDVR